MIEAASVASPRSKSPDVFAGGTDERDVLLDLFPRRWVTVAKADRILDVLLVLLRHAVLEGYALMGSELRVCVYGWQ
jgi:hypothetical protein